MWRDVTIKAALNGYMVVVGCQTLVYNSRKELIRDLVDYLDDPEKKSKEMQETGINRQWTEAPTGHLASSSYEGHALSALATIAASPPFATGTIDARV